MALAARRVTGAMKLAVADAGFERVMIVGAPGRVPMEVAGEMRRVWPARLTRSRAADATAFKRQLDSWAAVHPIVVHFDAWVESQEAAGAIIAAAETFIEAAHARIRGRWFDCDPAEAARTVLVVAAAKGRDLFDDEQYWRRVSARAADTERLMRGRR